MWENIRIECENTCRDCKKENCSYNNCVIYRIKSKLSHIYSPENINIDDFFEKPICNQCSIFDEGDI